MVDEVKLKKLAQDFVMAARNGLKNRDGEFTFVVLPDEEESKILIDQFGRLEESEMFYNYKRTTQVYDSEREQYVQKDIIPNDYPEVDFMVLANVFSKMGIRRDKLDELKQFLPRAARTLSTVERRSLAKKAPAFEKFCSPSH